MGEVSGEVADEAAAAAADPRVSGGKRISWFFSMLLDVMMKRCKEPLSMTCLSSALLLLLRWLVERRQKRLSLP